MSRQVFTKQFCSLCYVGVFAVMGILGSSEFAKAANINVDLNITTAGAGTFSGLGPAGAIAGTSWTGLAVSAKDGGTGTLVASYTSPGDLSASMPGTQTLTLTNIRCYDTSTFPDSNPGAFNPALFADYAYSPAGGTTFTINGVEAGTYDLYLIARNGGYNSQTSTFAVSTATPASATVTNAPANSGAYFLGGNYAKFSVVVDGSGIISGTFGSSGNPGQALNGFQLVSTSVPEPSGIFLFLIGMTGLGCAVRRKRSAVQ